MNPVSTVGLDLAKCIFQLHGADSAGAVVFRKKLRRGQLLAFLATLPPCTVAMEACASAHYWGREIAKLGHTVKLIAPEADRAGVREAVRAPSTWGGAWRGGLGRVGGGHDMYRQVPLRRLPLSRRGHQPRRLALLPLSAEPAHGGRDAGGPRHRREP